MRNWESKWGNKAENALIPNPKKKKLIIIISLVLAVLIAAATVIGVLVYRSPCL